MRHTLLFLGLAAICAAPASAQLPHSAREYRSPFTRLAEPTINGATLVSFDSADYSLFAEAHDAGAFVTLRSFALPGDEHVDLVLRPVEPVLPRGGVARVVTEDGETTIAPTVVTFAGNVPGEPGHAFLAVSPEAVHGYLELGERTFYVSSGDRTDAAYVTDASALSTNLPSEFCSAVGRARETATRQKGGREELGAGGATTIDLYVCEIFVEADHQLRALLGSDAATANYVVTLYTAVAQIYRRDLNALIAIPSGNLRIWNVVPPWGATNTFDDIFNVQAWWYSPANPDQFLDRDLVHVLTTPLFGGVAYIGALCDYERNYALNSVLGAFPYPVEHTSSDNADLYVAAHETGHNFNSQHTFDYVPPIECIDGSGPDNGTIMSYCHGDPSGMVNVGMRFHERVQLEQMRPYMESSSCLDVLVFEQGDYDLNSAVDATDLAIFDIVANQGFFSFGALETFDLNTDGALDSCDRRLLEDKIAGEVELQLAVNPSPMLRAELVTLTATNAAPGERVYFLYSSNGVGCGPSANQLGGMFLDIPTPIVLAARRTADGAGVASITTTVPSNFPPAFVGIQVVAKRGAGGNDSAKSQPIFVPVL